MHPHTWTGSEIGNQGWAAAVETRGLYGRVQRELRTQIEYYGRYMALYRYRMEVFVLCVWL